MAKTLFPANPWGRVLSLGNHPAKRRMRNEAPAPLDTRFPNKS